MVNANVKAIIDQIINKLDSVKGQIELSPEYQTRPASRLNQLPCGRPLFPQQVGAITFI